MMAVSRRYRDQPQTALERAVFWAEYALRHKGAQHLRVAPRDMSYVQIYLLDVWAALFAALALFTYLAYALVRTLITSKNTNKLKVHQQRSNQTCITLPFYTIVCLRHNVPPRPPRSARKLLASEDDVHYFIVYAWKQQYHC